jgi:hypothetical protein
MMSQATTPVVGALQFPDLLERFPSAPSSSQMAKLQRNLGKPPKDLPVKRSPIADDPSWTAWAGYRVSSWPHPLRVP